MPYLVPVCILFVRLFVYFFFSFQKRTIYQSIHQSITQHVVEYLVVPRSTCVTITGTRGSGKTEMALQACIYVRERHRFDAIFFANCRATTPTPTVMAGAGGTVTPYLEDPGRLVRRARHEGDC